MDGSTDFERSRRIWRSELAIRRIGWVVNNTMGLAFHKSSGWPLRGKQTAVDDFMRTFEDDLQYLNDGERDRLRSLLLRRVTGLATGKRTAVALERSLRSVCEGHQAKLATIPGSLDKAKGSLAALIDSGLWDTDQAYDAMCLLPTYVPQTTVQQAVVEWKKELRQHIERYTAPIPIVGGRGKQKEIPNPLPPSHIFWTSRDFNEITDAVSRYRFMEAFDIGDFPETQTEIESMVVSALMESSPGWALQLIGDNEWPRVAEALFFSSRSSKLCARISPFIQMACTRVANQPHSDGWWPSSIARQLDQYRSEYLPDNYATALACVTLLRLARSRWQLERARQGVRWLANQQQSDGTWNRLTQQAKALKQELDLATTFLAAEAVRLSGLPGYDHTLQMADSAIMRQQDEDGTWNHPWFPPPLLTVLVVEHFEGQPPAVSGLTGYLGIARDFILRSHDLALEDNDNSQRLAIVTSFHGIEALLYACLTHPSVNIRIFESADKTIGMRKALDKLERHLQTAGVIPLGQPVQHRNDLDRLAYYRDQVVHKGLPIAEQDARDLADAAARFADWVCPHVFGHVLI